MAQTELDIVVVGAGIAGLSAAISLSRAGHNVTVLEKSSFKREAGFMITIGPTGLDVLNSFGFNYSRARAVDCHHVATYDGQTLERHKTLDIRDHSKTSRGAMTFYRPDLHSELKILCLLRGKFKSPKLLLGTEVVSVDADKATAHLANGSTISADLIVGADGERSLVKAAFKDPDMLRQAAYRIYRAIVPTETLVADDRQKAMLALTNSKFAMFTKGKRVLSWFEGRDGLLQDLEAGYILDLKTDPLPETDAAKTKEKMLEKFQDFHPDIVDALRKAERVSDWEVFYSRPLARLFKGKALLVGDAAHSMFPTTGQGGSQSLEDVGALGVLLSNIQHKAALPDILQIYEKLRKERMTVIQGTSGITFGTEDTFARERPWHIINAAGIKSGEEHLKFLYQYDVFAESRKALEEGMRSRTRL